MSIKNECAIVRDLLPLYAENMVCGETAEFVRGHLDGCASCRAELEQIGSAQSDAENRTDKNPAENDTAPLARIGKNIFKKKRQEHNHRAVCIYICYAGGFYF